MLHDFATILAVTNGIVTGSDCDVSVLHELVVRALLVDIEIDAVDVHAFRRETKSFALARELFECAAQHIRRRERLISHPTRASTPIQLTSDRKSRGDATSGVPVMAHLIRALILSIARRVMVDPFLIR